MHVYYLLVHDFSLGSQSIDKKMKDVFDIDVCTNNCRSSYLLMTKYGNFEIPSLEQILDIVLLLFNLLNFIIKHIVVQLYPKINQNNFLVYILIMWITLYFNHKI